MSSTTPDAETPVCYRHPDRETWVSCQRCGRPICPQCQTQAAVGVQCPECVREGASRMPRRSARAAVRAFAPGGATVVTYVLIGLNVVIYALQWLTSQQLTEAWFLDPYSIGSSRGGSSRRRSCTRRTSSRTCSSTCTRCSSSDRCSSRSSGEAGSSRCT